MHLSEKIVRATSLFLILNALPHSDSVKTSSIADGTKTQISDVMKPALTPMAPEEASQDPEIRIGHLEKREAQLMDVFRAHVAECYRQSDECKNTIADCPTVTHKTRCQSLQKRCDVIEDRCNGMRGT